MRNFFFRNTISDVLQRAIYLKRISLDTPITNYILELSSDVLSNIPEVIINNNNEKLTSIELGKTFSLCTNIRDLHLKGILMSEEFVIEISKLENLEALQIENSTSNDSFINLQIFRSWSSHKLRKLCIEKITGINLQVRNSSLRLRSSMSSVQSAAAGHVCQYSSAHVVRNRAAIWTLISF